MQGCMGQKTLSTTPYLEECTLCGAKGKFPPSKSKNNPRQLGNLPQINSHNKMASKAYLLFSSLVSLFSQIGSY